MKLTRQLIQFRCPMSCQRLLQQYSSPQYQIPLRASVTQRHTNSLATHDSSSLLNQANHKICPQNSCQISALSTLECQNIFRSPFFKYRHYSTQKPKDNFSLEEMAVRLANENGYLSWNRNGYLATAVGIAMQAEGKMPLSGLATDAMFSIAGANLAIGSSIFIYNIWKLHPHIGISQMGMYCSILGSIVHVMLWLFAILHFKGYIVEK